MAVRFALLGTLLVLLLATPVIAVAQYPPPGSSITLTPTDPVPKVGSTITVIVTLVDADGSPVAGVTCTAAISSQPGDSASVVQPDVTTNAEGVASVEVFVGDTAGQVTVLVTCDDLEASVVLSVGIEPIPPDTGSSGATSDTGSSLPASAVPAGIVVLVGVLVAGLIAGGVLARTRNQA